MNYAKANSINTDDEEYLHQVSSIYNKFGQLNSELDSLGLSHIRDMLLRVSRSFEHEIFEQIKNNPD